MLMLIKKLKDNTFIITGSAAGFLVFYACKILALIMNFGKPSYRISAEALQKLKNLFAGIQLDNVTVIPHAWLPAHIFNRSIEGMTFHNRIYIVPDCKPENNSVLLLLIHELVHVRQIRELGEPVFACRYGVQFLKNRGYGEGMPLEKEAYGLVKRVKSGGREL